MELGIDVKGGVGLSAAGVDGERGTQCHQANVQYPVRLCLCAAAFPP